MGQIALLAAPDGLGDRVSIWLEPEHSVRRRDWLTVGAFPNETVVYITDEGVDLQPQRHHKDLLARRMRGVVITGSADRAPQWATEFAGRTAGCWLVYPAAPVSIQVFVREAMHRSHYEIPVNEASFVERLITCLTNIYFWFRN